MKNVLPGLSSEERQKIVAKTLKRIKDSESFYREDRQTWKNCYKVYNTVKDAEGDTDEPNICLPIAYGIVEDAVARLAVPILQKLPIIVKAKAIKYAKQAINFYNAARDYFGSADYRLDYIAATRERVICGPSWDIYGWANDWMKGKAWKEVPKQSSEEYPVSYVGKVIAKVKALVNYSGTEEVDHDYPEKIGFTTTFPSIFHMYPEPCRSFKQMNWVIQEEDCVSLEDIRKARYKDPQTGEQIPVYDLTELEKDHKDALDKIRPANLQFDTGEKVEDIVHQHETDSEDISDEPAVHLLYVRQKNNKIQVIAQGKYLIQAIEDVYHYPALPVRLRNYTSDKENLFGKGILQPVLDVIAEADDIHNMSMQNWIRCINKMLVYDESVIKYPDDFKPRAGGKIRANLLAGGSVSNAFAAVDQPDVTGSMLSQESNAKGMIERAVSISDLSPGVDGTRQYHKTYGGMLEIQSNLARRFSVMLMSELAHITKQMEFMYWMFEQFFFDEMNLGFYDAGVFKAETYRREDFDSGGKGFLFIQSEDPGFGDSAVQRNQLMVQYDLALKHEQHRLLSKDPDIPKVDLGEAIKRVFEAMGNQDLSRLLISPDGVMSPDDEYNMILQGVPPEVNPKENLMRHLIDHVIQRNKPELLALIQADKVKPEVLTMLDRHINDTKQLMSTMVQNIDEVAQVKAAEESAMSPLYEKITPPAPVNSMPVLAGEGNASR